MKLKIEYNLRGKDPRASNKKVAYIFSTIIVRIILIKETEGNPHAVLSLIFARPKAKVLMQA